MVMDSLDSISNLSSQSAPNVISSHLEFGAVVILIIQFAGEFFICWFRNDK